MNTVKKSISVILIVVMAFAFTGCFFFSPDQDEFKDALEDVFDLQAEQYFVSLYSSKNAPIDGCVATITYSGSVGCYYYEFNDSKKAHAYFGMLYEDFENDFENYLFKGSYKKSDSSLRGFIYLDGNAVAGATSFIGNGRAYGGVYYNDKVVVIVITSEDISGAREFLDEIGLPYL